MKRSDLVKPYEEPPLFGIDEPVSGTMALLALMFGIVAIFRVTTVSFISQFSLPRHGCRPWGTHTYALIEKNLA